MTDTSVPDIRDDRERITNDEYLSAFYATAYQALADVIPDARSQRTVEIGSGLALAAASGHDWLHSDVSLQPNLNVVNIAQQLPFPAGSLDALVLKDTWHHIPDIEGFLGEAHRVLRQKGVVAIFDPYWGFTARFVYRFLHQERWDARTPTWTFSSSDPWDSNQALTYIMLRRDRSTFEHHWSEHFEIVEHRRLIGPSFLISGGVSRRTFVSGRLLSALLRWEERQGRWFDHFRFFHVFSLRKR